MNTIKKAIASIAESGSSSNGDAGMKKVLALVPLLARIMKRCVAEFKDIPVEDIEALYLDPDRIYISEVPVEKDFTNNVDVKSVRGLQNEDTSINEGTIYYDIIFYVKVPGEADKEIGLYINVEGQAKLNPGYHIETRGLFYAARRFGSQKTTLTEATNYDELEKVYSIWVCVGLVPDKYAGTITEYSIEKKDIIGKVEQDRSIYDKMTVIMIRVNDKMQSDDTLLNGLKDIFSNEASFEKKIQAFENMGINVTDEIREDVNDMCNYGDYLYNSGVEQGISQGISQGERNIYFKMVDKGRISSAEAAAELKMTEKDFLDEMEKAGYKVLVLA